MRGSAERDLSALRRASDAAAYFYAKSNQRALTDTQLKWVQQWFWRASFSQYYGSGGPTKMGRDKELFDGLISGSSPCFEPPLGDQVRYCL
jgi:hypothetical protein